MTAVLWVAYKQIWRSRQLGLSQTAVEIVNGRWTGDVFGLREDKPSRPVTVMVWTALTSGLVVPQADQPPPLPSDPLAVVDAPAPPARARVMRTPRLS